VASGEREYACCLSAGKAVATEASGFKTFRHAERQERIIDSLHEYRCLRSSIGNLQRNCWVNLQRKRGVSGRGVSNPTEHPSFGMRYRDIRNARLSTSHLQRKRGVTYSGNTGSHQVWTNRARFGVSMCGRSYTLVRMVVNRLSARQG
jgi:hypothetical protein